MYYGYYRVSTGTQVEKGQGLETQRQAIEKYAADNNIEIAGWFHDDGISGTDENREGLTELLSVLGKDDKVIVLQTSRLWRSDIVKVLVHKSMKKVGADIISLEQPNYTIYSKDPTEVLFNGMMELLDQYTRLETNMKLAKGRRTKAKGGDKGCGSAPIGYVWNGKHIEVDIEKSVIVTDIFRAYIELKSLSGVVNYCTSMGYKTLHGKDFSKQAIKNILTNDFYIGYVCHAGNKYNGNHQTFITIEIFNSVQNIMGRKPI